MRSAATLELQSIELIQDNWLEMMENSYNDKKCERFQ